MLCVGAASDQNRGGMLYILMSSQLLLPIFLGTTCNFESAVNSKCGWRNIIRDNLDWVRQSGQTPTFRTGPASDHSIGTSQGLFCI